MTNPKTVIKADSKQDWRTPPDIFKQLNSEVGGYGIDLFADDENHLCKHYFSADNSAFDQHWNSKKICFGNPPYGHGFVDRAIQCALNEVNRGRCAGVDLLLKCDTSTKWFLTAFQNCEIHLFHRRIQFVSNELTASERAGKARSSSNFSNCLVRIRPSGPIGITTMRDGKTGMVLK